MKVENGNYTTEDIHLATFLKVKGIELVEIIYIAPFRSKFVFNHVPQKVLDTFLSTPAEVPLRNCINEYRHLLRQSRNKEQVVRK